MLNFIKKQWLQISLMVLLLIITIYFVDINNVEALSGTIIPMIAIGLNLNKDD